ncbi:hypothetical protein [Metabacillus litoralis]|uniref:Uncharacterized protein n=1 Tax=Metabacillus litoralis TaxID=152268 RepID=A0A179T4I0_9BACI|nr:hypothetical protein [Metabacillus litoralis]OAS88300.1 hypothetical protein A6K24_16465 [Metabacillus litoralis]
MEKEKISSLQLFYILIGFEFGTLSLLIGRDFVTHLEIAFKYLNIYVLTLMHIILPILFFCIAFIRKKVLS